MANVTDAQKLAIASDVLGGNLLASLLANLDVAAKSLDDAGVERKERKLRAKTKAVEVEIEDDGEDEDEDEDMSETKEGDDEDSAFVKRFGGAMSKAMEPIMKQMAEMKASMHTHDETAKTEKSQQGLLVDAFKQALADNNRILAQALAFSVQGLQVQTTKNAVAGALAELTSLTKEVQKASNKSNRKVNAVNAVDELDDEPVATTEKGTTDIPLSDFFTFVTG